MRGAVVLLVLIVVGACVATAAAQRTAPPCSKAQLRAQLFLQGATGSLAGGVYVRNVGRSTCSLVGQPQARLVGGGARTTRWKAHVIRPFGREGIGHRPTASLRAFRPRARALLSIQWSNWCRPGSYPAGKPGKPPRALVIRLPHRGAFRFKLGDTTPRCDAPERPSYLGFSRFVPV